MPDIVGVRFRSCGKIYNFSTDGLDVKIGDMVVVESDMGLSIGRVINRHVVETPPRPVKQVTRIATEEDMEAYKANRTMADEARAYCIERIRARDIEMHLVCTEVTLDRKRIIFYFSADRRVDFRELVKDLAARFRTRIEMRQIGVRDEVKFIGGLGVCGRETCCSSFLTVFEPISLRMAKRQELSPNPTKLSGICGRLMCCLSYEYEEYGFGGVEVEAEPAEEAFEEKAVEESLNMYEDNKIVEKPVMEVKPEAEGISVAQTGYQNSEKKPCEKVKERGKPFNKRRRFSRKRR